MGCLTKLTEGSEPIRVDGNERRENSSGGATSEAHDLLELRQRGGELLLQDWDKVLEACAKAGQSAARPRYVAYQLERGQKSGKLHYQGKGLCRVNGCNLFFGFAE